MADKKRQRRIVEEISVERGEGEIYLDTRLRRPKGKRYHLRRLVLTEDQARNFLDELMNAGLG